MDVKQKEIINIRNNMKTKNQKLRMVNCLAIIFAASLLNTCTLREIEDDPLMSVVTVNIDWSLSGLSVQNIHRVSIWLFPHDGGSPLEYRLEGNLTFREITVPVGVYSALVFNETIDADDWNGIVFSGVHSYETFAALSVPQSSMGFYKHSEGLPLADSPEALAAWCVDMFEVKPAVAGGNTLFKNNQSKEDKVLNSITPLPRFERVSITARVDNLASSMQITGTINGMASGVYMASGEKINDPAAHAFILNKRVYDEDGRSGKASRTFNVFGILPSPTRLPLAIDFMLNNGLMHPTEEFDVTDIISSQKLHNVITHVITLGIDDDDNIILPQIDMGNGISVDGWDEVVIPVN